MVRKTGGLGGTIYSDPKGRGDKHQAEQRTKAKKGSKFFRNFWRTKTKAYMLTYDDTQHLTIMLNVLNNLSAGDPQTAINTLLDGAWQLGAKTGNMKEVNTTELSNFKVWVAEWLTIAWDVMAQFCLRPFLAGITESSTTATAVDNIAIWATSDWENFIAMLEKYDCPDFVYRFLKPFQYYIEMTPAYTQAELPIPPSYLLLNAHTHALSTLQAHFTTVKGAMGYAQTHCQKYGIPFSKFSLDKLKCVEVKRKDVFNNQDLIALFNILPMRYTDDTPTESSDFHAAILTGANLISDFENIDYVFDDTQDMSIVHAMFPLFGVTYNVTNNMYGEILSYMQSGPAEYDMNFLHMKLLGTAWTQGDINSVGYAAEMLLSYYRVDAERNLAYTGTKMTADKTYGLTRWLAYRENPNLCHDSGHVRGAEALNQALMAGKYMLYGD